MDLLCLENSGECRAYLDPVLLDDDRVLANMLKQEDRYSPSPYFSCQSEITPAMRKIVADWMLEVCEEQKCESAMFPLAVNLLDRFLSVQTVQKKHLQLLATACLLLASKMREAQPTGARLLVYYTDNSITETQLLEWETLVVAKLKWDVGAVVPQDFLQHIVRALRLQLSGDEARTLLGHANAFIGLMCRAEAYSKYSLYTPSILAAASIVAALHGMQWTIKHNTSVSQLLDQLHVITSIEKEFLEGCFNFIEELLSAAMSSAPEADEDISGQRKTNEHNTSGTPTDVHDVHF